MTLTCESILTKFPSVSSLDVSNYLHLAENYANILAKEISSKGNRSFSNVKKSTMMGFESKIAAALIHGENPEEVINFNYIPGVFENYINGSDIMTATLENSENEDSIVVSLSRYKYNSILNRMDRSSYSAERIEFIYFDRNSDRFYHLGSLNSSNLPVPSDSNERRVYLKFPSPLNQETSIYQLDLSN